MAMLGDLLAAARRSAGVFQPWLEASDPKLAADVSAAAAREGLTPAAFARVAVADFSRLASEEDWATLVSSMRDSDDPGSVCLLAMVHWRLTARGCGDHSFAGSTYEGGAIDERLATRSAD
jgi:hypothetical protein